MPSEIAIGLLLLVVAAVGYKLLRGGLGDATFVVEVKGPGIEGVQIRGSVPGHAESDVAEFVAGLELPAGARIWAVPDRDRIRLRFSGGVPDNLQQRLRNFFYTAL